MIVLMMIVGVVLVAVAALFLVKAGAVPRLHMESHLAQIDGYGTEPGYGDVDGDAGTASGPSLSRLAERFGQLASRSIPSLPRLERKDLNAAGIYSTKPEVVDGYRLLAGGAAGTVALLYATALNGGIPLLVSFALGAALLGWRLPALVIQRRGRKRLVRIDKQLPDLVDLLVASVEAGMGVGASLALLGDRFEGPLGEELRLVLHQQRLGVSTATAMETLAERADTQGIRAFTRTLVRAEAMGGSIGQVLRNLAADARRRRRQAAAERAAKVPLKLMFPLILLVFPALFVVLLYPAAYTIVQQFGS